MITITAIRHAVAAGKKKNSGRRCRPGALSEPLIHVAKARANVMTINHTRNVRGIPLGRAYIDLELETRGKEHIREVSDYLENNGYRINSSEMNAGDVYNGKEQ